MLLKNQELEPLHEYTAVKVVTDLLCLSERNKENPSLAEVVQYVIAQVEENKPLKFIATIPLRETFEMRRQRLCSLLGESGNFSTAYDPRPDLSCLPCYAPLCRELAYPFELTLAIDDRAFYTEIKAPIPPKPNEFDLSALQRKVLCRQTRNTARKLLGLEAVKAAFWSELSTDYAKCLAEARDLSNWKKDGTTHLLESRMEMCFNPWSWQELKIRHGLSATQIERILLNELISLAAALRARANYALSSNSLLLWSCERGDLSLWQIMLSNFNGRGVAPSLILR